jgi:hypothetical protein
MRWRPRRDTVGSNGVAGRRSWALPLPLSRRCEQGGQETATVGEGPVLASLIGGFSLWVPRNSRACFLCDRPGGWKRRGSRRVCAGWGRQMHTRRLLLESRVFAYWVVRRPFELLVLFGRSERRRRSRSSCCGVVRLRDRGRPSPLRFASSSGACVPGTLAALPLARAHVPRAR